MIKQIFVDMDGVLSDFMGRYHELFNSKPERDYPSNNQKKKAYQRNWQEFVDDGNFATLDSLPDFAKGIEYLKELQAAGYEMFILSSTAKEEFYDEISKQKIVWLQEHGIDFHPIFVPGKALKRLYAGPGKVLIDDTLSNVEQWDEDGGIAIHHSDWEDTINKLNSILNI